MISHGIEFLDLERVIEAAHGDEGSVSKGKRMLELLWRMFQAWRFNQAMNAPTGTNSCVACDGFDVEEFAPRVYRCVSCGYEGGPGHAEYMAARKAERLAALDEPAKRARAKRLLDDAHLLLLSGHGTFNSARVSGWIDALNLGGSGYAGTAGEGWEKQQEFVSAVGDILRAQAQMEEAASLLGVEFPRNLEFREELGYAEAVFDRAFDNIASDMAFIVKAANSMEMVKRMHVWCGVQRSRLKG